MSHQRPAGGFTPWQPPPEPPGALGPRYGVPENPQGDNPFAPPAVVLPPAGARISKAGTRPWAWWTLGVLGVVGVVMAAFAIVPRAVPVIQEKATTSRVLAGGYSSFTGPRGLTVTGGAPWGAPCAAVLVHIPEHAPSVLETAIRDVVAEAHRGGVNVSVATGTDWDMTGFVRPPEVGTPPRHAVIVLDDGEPGTTRDGSPTTVTMGWSMERAPDGASEYLTQLRARFYTQTLAGDALTERKAVRYLIGWSQGISGSSLAGSGIASLMHLAGDAFTPSDLAAMRTMSGCG